MKLSWLKCAARLLRGVLVCYAAAALVRAHEPFDVSSRIVIDAERLEVVVTLGTEGVRNFFSGAGRSVEEIAESMQSRGPDRPVIQPVVLAARIFQLTNNGAVLEAKGVRSVSEGAEILFTLTFVRPAAGVLEIRATCYEAIKGLRNGVLVVEDEVAGQLGAALLSAARPQLTVTVPARADAFITQSTAAVDASPIAGQPVEQRPAPSFGAYFALGVEHILMGIDHLLFLAALLIGVRRLPSMLGIITCFTLAHSVTLAMAALDVVTISSRVVEPLIAASIIVVSAMNFLRGAGERDRVLFAGSFGLIHGFGFAGVLRETGLGGDQGPIALPLLSFNLGVEAGQLAVAAIIVPLLFWGRHSAGFVRYGLPAISAAVIVISGYWLVERVFF